MTRLTDEVRAAVLARVAVGESMTSIARALGITYNEACGVINTRYSSRALSTVGIGFADDPDEPPALVVVERARWLSNRGVVP